mmetsp:Transcript_3660/g.10509  ORF Transcript_3660/g.10509 Transcript_3660/m.10509 type:complete len:363 (+) Transcript_3660:127-1215(+)
MERFDEMLMGMASQSGGIEPMLQAVFSFLHRRTDFYVVKDAMDRSARMGFNAGEAERILLRCFHAFPIKGMDGRPLPAAAQPAVTPPRPSAEKEDQATAKGKELLKRSPPATAKPAPATAPEAAAPAPSTPTPRAEEDPSVMAAAMKLTDDGKQVPVNNGGATDEYVWTQTLTEATVYVPLPDGLGARDLTVELAATGLDVGRKAGKAGEAGEAVNPQIITGRWPRRVQRDESVWMVQDGVLTVSLDKAERGWWKSCFEGGPEIDTSLVDSRAKVDDYDGETQGVIRKIMFDQQQKAMGLPTSDEMAQAELWEKAKFAPGSPFLPGGPMAGEEDDVRINTAAGAGVGPPGVGPMAGAGSGGT